ncbi:MAG: translation initiation factor eIF-1A [Candidatus Aenigmarchaeota archaeon]|nr:translation initiation factor eIF-1A [Candidatus Aenigmarchaeota archaeon]
MEEIVERVKIPKGNQTFGLVESKLGGNKFRVTCQDGKSRICRVPGRLRRRLWLNPGNIVIVEPWEIQGDEKGDIIHKYSNAQIEWLRKKGYLNL